MKPNLGQFLETNPALYPELVRLAREARQAGYTRFGFRAIWERTDKAEAIRGQAGLTAREAVARR